MVGKDLRCLRSDLPRGLRPASAHTAGSGPRNVKKRDVFTRYGAQARAVLDALLDKYADEGLTPAEDLGVLRVQPLSGLGTPVELVGRFGGRGGYVAAVRARSKPAPVRHRRVVHDSM